MPKLKVLSGPELVRIFSHFGFSVLGQKGSHLKVGRVQEGSRQVLTIPNHKELDRGTLKAIYNQALRYIPDHELRGFFYSE